MSRLRISDCGLRNDSIADCGLIRLRIAECGLRNDLISNCGLRIAESTDFGLRNSDEQSGCGLILIVHGLRGSQNRISSQITDLRAAGFSFRNLQSAFRIQINPQSDHSAIRNPHSAIRSFRIPNQIIPQSAIENPQSEILLSFRLCHHR
jgi:hypothetical protein